MSFLTGGETMLLLGDLVRRKVLREHTVPDSTAVSQSGQQGRRDFRLGSHVFCLVYDSSGYLCV